MLLGSPESPSGEPNFRRPLHPESDHEKGTVFSNLVRHLAQNAEYELLNPSASAMAIIFFLVTRPLNREGTQSRVVVALQ